MAYQIYSYLAKSECFCCCQLFDYGFLMNENAELLLVAIKYKRLYVFENTLPTNCFLSQPVFISCNLFQI